MANLSINAETLKSELQVVGEERRWRVDNNPMGMLHEELMATLYKVHPYKWPVIGYMSDIQAYTSEKLRYFHDNFYVPNNAVLVIAGDFNTEEVKKMIKANYGPLKSKPLPVLSINPEPEQSEPTTVVKKADVQATTFLVAYHGVESGHPDSYALDLLASILGNGNSSRLYKKLVYDKQEAMNSFAFNDTNKDPGYFAVGSSLKPKNSYKKSLHLIYSEIEKVRTQLINKKELDKVKNQVMKNFVDELTTIHEKAEALAVNEIVAGSYEQLFKDLELYKKVTPEEIKKVALKYLNQNQRSVVVLEPK
jgi:zinc protease